MKIDEYFPVRAGVASTTSAFFLEEQEI
jgi:hypothetical protein